MISLCVALHFYKTCPHSIYENYFDNKNSVHPNNHYKTYYSLIKKCVSTQRKQVKFTHEKWSRITSRIYFQSLEYNSNCSSIAALRDELKDNNNFIQ